VLGQLLQRRPAQDLPGRQQHDGQRAGVVRQPGHLEQVPALGAADVQVAERHLVAGQELLGRLRLRRPLVPEHGDAGERRPAARPPLGEQLVQRRVEPLLRRVPRLEQVAVEVDVVDGPDGRVGVGVRVSSTRLAPGARSIACSRKSIPVIPGIRWSASSSAICSPRSVSSCSASSAERPSSARTTRWSAP
jgi:hypothetical protein